MNKELFEATQDFLSKFEAYKKVHRTKGGIEPINKAWHELLLSSQRVKELINKAVINN